MGHLPHLLEPGMNIMKPNEPPTPEEEQAYAYYHPPANLKTDQIVKVARSLNMNVQEITEESVELTNRRQVKAARDLRELVDEMASVCRAIEHTLDEFMPTFARNDDGFPTIHDEPQPKAPF